MNILYAELVDGCSQCKDNLDDHFLYHLACHLSCRFCENVSQHLPHMNFTIPQIRGHWPELWEVRVSASLFEHKPGYIEPNRDQNLKYPCDKCEKYFPIKVI